MEIYRTFIGLPVKVDGAFLSDREYLMHQLRGERISWVRPENFHITLRFIGDTPLKLVKQIGPALKQEVDDASPGELSLRGPDYFGPEKRPRVIWLGFLEEDYLAELRNQVDRTLQKFGLEFPVHPYSPHLTLGRIRRLHDLHSFHNVLDRSVDSFRGKQKIDSLNYYRSIILPGQPVKYEVL